MQSLENRNNVIVFSHLRWDFVWQRPQHIISRLARTNNIFFVEEPIPYSPDEEGTFKITERENGIVVLQPRMQSKNLIAHMAKELMPLIASYKMTDPILWFYSPMFKQISKYIPHSMMIYDCMDQLSAFKNAPPALLKNERELLVSADLVFTGGKSLYEDKMTYNRNVHCFPSSVEREHFAKALVKQGDVPADIKNIPHPIVGYYGVIDERMDQKLLKEIATRLPHVSFVLIGPVVKIDPEKLPRLPNIHYLGQKQYDELPDYLRAIDVAMMPFALNRSTKFISPTKTLEYMAALKPIVSTPIYDVVRDYSNEVAIVSTAAQFSKAIESYLSETPTERKLREAKMEAILNNTSWDKTTQKMEGLIEKAQDKSGLSVENEVWGNISPQFTALQLVEQV
jgi:glycosyltransferase involved in cell wall biosynthesis